MFLKHTGFIPRWIQNAFNQVLAKCAPKFPISWARRCCLLEHYSTSLCRLIQWTFLSMDYVSECMFVQAGSSFSSRFSSSPMCCCLRVWQSGINAKNIFIFYHKWTTTKKSEQFHTLIQWQKKIFHYLNSQLCCLSLPDQPPQGKYNSFFGPRKRSPGWPLAKKTLLHGLLLPHFVLGTVSSWDRKGRKRRKRPLNVHIF